MLTGGGEARAAAMRSPFQTHTQSPSHPEKNIRQTQPEARPTKYLPGSPYNCQGQKRLGKSEEASQPRGA